VPSPLETRTVAAHDGFDITKIAMPVKVWHGHQDRMVPVQHGEWLSAHIPSADAEISEESGHLTMIGHASDFHDWLLPQLRR